MTEYVENLKATSCDYLFVQSHQQLALIDKNTGQQRILTAEKDNDAETQFMRDLGVDGQNYLLVKLPRIPFSTSVDDLINTTKKSDSELEQFLNLKQTYNEKKAKRAEKNRIRYHSMTPEQKRAFNKKRCEASKRRRALINEIMKKPYGQATSEEIEIAQQIILNKRKKKDRAAQLCIVPKKEPSVMVMPNNNTTPLSANLPVANEMCTELKTVKERFDSSSVSE